ncbi:polysaccharide pyruvyl transferase family protein [Kocuria palustris]|uniref:polysaccharide pyruvyl transferase family protein n=1 Tax=Kocuria palustris TaxID=71999 RepID=UPI00344EC2CC
MKNVYAHITTVNSTTGNLGDMMGFHIADHILGDGAYRRLGIRSKDDVPGGTVALVGSLIAALTHAPCRIVGGGLINGSRRVYGPEFRAEAVRGFLTQTILARDAGQTPEVIGDPGLLLSDLQPMRAAEGRQRLGFIIHAVDREEFVARYPEHEADIIDNYGGISEFVDQLSRYDAVASTSLHGCIFAHSYGIPVAPFVLTDKVFGGDFKFRDHYSALGIDVRRTPLEGTSEDMLRTVQRTVQPSAQQIQRLKARQWEAIREALGTIGR